MQVIDSKSTSKTRTGTIFMTEETLENDDRFYSLGIFSKQQTFFTFADELETSEYERNQSLILEIEFFMH